MPHYPHRSEARERDRRPEQDRAAGDLEPRPDLHHEQDSQDARCDARWHALPNRVDKHDITGQHRHDRHEQAPEEKVEEEAEEADVGELGGITE